MPIEIHELVLQARVTDEAEALPDMPSESFDEEALESLKAEILADCARLIKREHDRRKSR